MGLRTTRNSRLKSKASQNKAIKSNNVVANKNSSVNNKAAPKTVTTSTSANSTTVKQNVSSSNIVNKGIVSNNTGLKTSTNKTQQNVNQVNTSNNTVNNIKSIKNSNTGLKTTVNTSNNNIINKGIVSNNTGLKTSVNKTQQNVNRVNTSNNTFNNIRSNTGLKTTVNRRKVNIKRVPTNITKISSNNIVNGRIISKNAGLKTSVSKNIKANIKRLSVNTVKFTGRTIKSGANKFADGKVLKDTELDTNYENEIGANTLKGVYKGTLKTVKGTKATIRGAKATIHGAKATVIGVKNIPKNYRRVKTTIKNLPSNLKGRIKTARKTAKQKYAAIYVKTVERNMKGLLDEIPLKKIGRASRKGVSKVLINSGKISTRMTIKGVNRFGRSFKKAALKTKVDETSDLGTNTVFATATVLKETARVVAKGTRGTYRTYGKLKTVKKKKLNVSKGKIKTKVGSNRISQNVKKYFQKFKTSKVAQKQIKKVVKQLRNKVGQAIVQLSSVILKNPFVLGTIAIIIVVGLVFSILLNAIFGVHASYFIEIEPNQTKWITNMERLDESIRTRVEEHDHVRTVRKSGTKADWRDVIIAYYMKNNNDTSLAGGSISLGGAAVSVDPETWAKVLEELESHLGEPYQWGGCTPSTGFDCSGLVQYCYGKFGITLPRTTYEQVLCGTHVDMGDLKAGDLVFFGTAGDVHHVGVYLGNGQYLHSPQTGDVVKVSELISRSDFYEGRRVFEEKEDTSEDGDTPADGESESNSDDSSSDEERILYTALPNNTDLVDIFYKVGEETGVDPILLASIAMQESSLNPNAVSSAGASGLCQLMPNTFSKYADSSQIFDPYTNVTACAKYVNELYSYSYINTPEDMLTAYNGGPGNFDIYRGPIPGNTENQQYSGKVLNYYSQLSNGEQPVAMSGGAIQSNGVNATLSQVYSCFVEFYKKDGSDDKWILRLYTVEEALDNLGFTEEEKEEFYRFKDYNEDFDEEGQFKGYDVDFDFDVK